MSQKKLLVVILSVLMVSIVVVPIGLLYVLNNGNPYTKYLADKYVPTHLEEVGYSTEDIKQAHYIEPKHIINKDFYHGHYKVIFQDEPTVVYYYGVTKKGKEVIQFCEREPAIGIVEQITEQTKHSVLDCEYSLEKRKTGARLDKKDTNITNINNQIDVFITEIDTLLLHKPSIKKYEYSEEVFQLKVKVEDYFVSLETTDFYEIDKFNQLLDKIDELDLSMK